MLGPPTKPPVIVPRLGSKGFINIKRLSIMLAFIFVIYVIWIAIIWFNVIPQMEEQHEDNQITDNFMKGTTFHLIRLAYFLTLIVFGPLDFILAFMLWRATPPLKNVGILWPLLIIYVFHRILIILLVMLLSSIVVLYNDFDYLIDIIYYSILIFLLICSIIIAIIYRKVLSHSYRDYRAIYFPKDKGI